MSDADVEYHQLIETQMAHRKEVDPIENRSSYGRLLHHFIPNKRRVSLSRNCRRRTFIFLLLLPLKIVLAYFVFRTDFYLTRMTVPTTVIHRPEMAKCCLDPDIGKDVCGRTGCLWPCPFTPNDYRTLGENEYDTGDRAFFHETSGARSIDFRQGCSVESLAMLNPNLTVNLLMTAPPDLSSLVMRTLTDNYRNVRITAVNLGDYMIGTPLAHWYFCTTWNYGWWAYAHLSDALRFLSLSKFGGYYFDLDVIQKRPLDGHRNFAAAEDGSKIGSSVLHFDRENPFLHLAVEEFHTNYRRDHWAHNGPNMLTRIAKSWCNTRKVTRMDNNVTCNGFQVLPPWTFYPVHYFLWKELFYQRTSGDNPDWYEDDHVLGVHVWHSSNSNGWPIDKHSNQLYSQLARHSCPRIFDIAPVEF